MGIYLGILYYLIAQVLVWLQLYGPLKIDWMKDNKWIVYAMALPITYIFILATKYTVDAMDGATWGSRFIQSGIGVITFAFMAWYINDEGINLKTGISIFLVLILIMIQLMWK
jgi:hypothetical protein